MTIGELHTGQSGVPPSLFDISVTTHSSIEESVVKALIRGNETNRWTRCERRSIGRYNIMIKWSWRNEGINRNGSLDRAKSFCGIFKKIDFTHCLAPYNTQDRGKVIKEGTAQFDGFRQRICFVLAFCAFQYKRPPIPTKSGHRLRSKMDVFSALPCPRRSVTTGTIWNDIGRFYAK